MIRYRYIQYEEAEASVISWLNLEDQGYHNFQEARTIKGWAVSTQAKIDYIKLNLYSNLKREFQIIDSFTKSPDVAKAYPDSQNSDEARFIFTLSQENAEEIQQQEDFALEFVAVSQGVETVFKTLVFVKDFSSVQMVFVLGSPRSGTSILGNTLNMLLTGKAMFGENHVLALMDHLSIELDDYYLKHPAAKMPKNMLNELNPYLLKTKIHNVFKSHYESLSPNKVMVDKTPGIPMLMALPNILRIWPQAQIVFAKRRALENIASRLRKFPQTGFESHCRQWAQSQLQWSRLRKQVNRYVEIDQYDIQHHPDSVAEELQHFLNLVEEAKQYIYNAFLTNRPEQTTQNNDFAAKSLKDMNWSKSEREIYKKYCKKAMRIYNYSETESYYKELEIAEK